MPCQYFIIAYADPLLNHQLKSANTFATAIWDQAVKLSFHWANICSCHGIFRELQWTLASQNCYFCQVKIFVNFSTHTHGCTLVGKIFIPQIFFILCQWLHRRYGNIAIPSNTAKIPGKFFYSENIPWWKYIYVHVVLCKYNNYFIAWNYRIYSNSSCGYY